MSQSAQASSWTSGGATPAIGVMDSKLTPCATVPEIGEIGEKACHPSPKVDSGSRQRPNHRAEHLNSLLGLKNFFRLPLHPSLTLENSGSVARDHLASERTFLAYVRTSLALASTGVALVQLFTIAEMTSSTTDGSSGEIGKSKGMQRFAKPLGVISVALALVMLGMAAYRYFLIQNALTNAKFPVARMSVAFTSVVLGVVVVAVFAALIVGKT